MFFYSFQIFKTNEFFCGLSIPDPGLVDPIERKLPRELVGSEGIDFMKACYHLSFPLERLIFANLVHEHSFLFSLVPSSALTFSKKKPKLTVKYFFPDFLTQCFPQPTFLSCERGDFPLAFHLPSSIIQSVSKWKNFPRQRHKNLFTFSSKKSILSLNMLFPACQRTKVNVFYF